MTEFNPTELKQLYIPKSGSHKGQNGKLMVIGGSHLFHAASLWSMEIASKIVDMVFYSSVPENEKIVQEEKEQFRNGIIVPRENLENYIEESDCILIGPGMVRVERAMSNAQYPTLPAGRQVSNLSEIHNIQDEGEQTYYLTKYLLEKFPHKKWVVDAGALQMLDLEDLKRIGGNVILTPHKGEFERVFDSISKEDANTMVQKMAQRFNCVILFKGERDIICSPNTCVSILGGNAGMTKGGTGDVLAGLVAALACNNDLVLAAKAGSYFNKKAGENLFKKVGYYFNATDLLREIPHTMKEYLL